MECKATAEGFERSADVSAQRLTWICKVGAGSEEEVTERSPRSHFASRFIIRGRSSERKRRVFGPKAKGVSEGSHQLRECEGSSPAELSSAQMVGLLKCAEAGLSASEASKETAGLVQENTSRVA